MTTNKIMPVECEHVASGSMDAIEEVHFVSVGRGLDDDFRYTKGPDVMRLCALCAGNLMAVMHMPPVVRTGPMVDDVIAEIGALYAKASHVARNGKK